MHAAVRDRAAVWVVAAAHVAGSFVDLGGDGTCGSVVRPASYPPAGCGGLLAAARGSIGLLLLMAIASVWCALRAPRASRWVSVATLVLAAIVLLANEVTRSDGLW